MKILWNIVLGLLSVLSAAVLILQDFVLPALTPALSVILRLVMAVCVQTLFLRFFEKRIVQYIPILAAAVCTIWGFFLYLSSPSWVGVTFQSFLADYATFLLGCCLVWGASWLAPRLLPRIKKALKARKRAKKKKKKKQAK